MKKLLIHLDKFTKKEIRNINEELIIIANSYKLGSEIDENLIDSSSIISSSDIAKLWLKNEEINIIGKKPSWAKDNKSAKNILLSENNESISEELKTKINEKYKFFALTNSNLTNELMASGANITCFFTPWPYIYQYIISEEKETILEALINEKFNKEELIALKTNNIATKKYQI